ncbi:MAG: 4Fe-4S binding protein [candidate division Zixibacteria bacterium]|nr:4Fe-4S binding protein [candidate division Zixibacteria bacterium]
MRGFRLTVDEESCGLCGGCVAVCAFDALLIDADGIHEIPDRCTSCGLCIITCPSRALVLEDEVKV